MLREDQVFNRCEGPVLSDYRALAQLAAETARMAGAALLAHRSEWAAQDSVQGREVKIRADAAAEALILPALRAASPYPVLSEEAGWSGAAGPRFWAVDPLDGSVNYLLGYPHVGVSIALVDDGQPVLGAFYNFVLNEMFFGAVGQGAELNGRAMQVSDVTRAPEGLLATGIPARARTDQAFAAQLTARMLAFRKVRMIGSAAAALCNVAAGRADAYWEEAIMLWDVAAGCALVRAAGGRVQINGPALDQPLLVTADNGKLAWPGDALL